MKKSSRKSSANVHRQVIVRRDRDTNSWAILDKDYKIVDRFENGVLVNVEFGVKPVEEAPTCASHGRKAIGIAIGRLIKGSRKTIPLSKVRHFSFTDQGFCDLDGNPLKSAKGVYLGAKGNAFYIV